MKKKASRGRPRKKAADKKLAVAITLSQQSLKWLRGEGENLSAVIEQIVRDRMGG